MYGIISGIEHHCEKTFKKISRDLGDLKKFKEIVTQNTERIKKIVEREN